MLIILTSDNNAVISSLKLTGCPPLVKSPVAPFINYCTVETNPGSTAFIKCINDFCTLSPTSSDWE